MTPKPSSVPNELESAPEMPGEVDPFEGFSCIGDTISDAAWGTTGRIYEMELEDERGERD